MLPLELARPRRCARAGARACWSASASARAAATIRASSPAASSSASRWRAPRRRARPCCSPTSPPAISTPSTGERIVELLFDLNADAQHHAGARHARSRARGALRARADAWTAASWRSAMRAAPAWPCARWAANGVPASWRCCSLSLHVAVAALTGVGFLVDRIGRAMQRQASEVLAADLRAGVAGAARRGCDRSRAAAAGLADRAADDAALGRVSRRCRASWPMSARPARAIRCAACSRSRRSRSRRRASRADLPAPGEAWPDSRLAAALGARRRR